MKQQVGLALLGALFLLVGAAMRVASDDTGTAAFVGGIGTFLGAILLIVGVARLAVHLIRSED